MNAPLSVIQTFPVRHDYLVPLPHPGWLTMEHQRLKSDLWGMSARLVPFVSSESVAGSLADPTGLVIQRSDPTGHTLCWPKAVGGFSNKLE